MNRLFWTSGCCDRLLVPCCRGARPGAGERSKDTGLEQTLEELENEIDRDPLRILFPRRRVGNFKPAFVSARTENWCVLAGGPGNPAIRPHGSKGIKSATIFGTNYMA